MADTVASGDPALSQMVADAYAKLSGDPNALAKPAVDAVAEAYGGIPAVPALKRYDELQNARGVTADAWAAVQPRTLLPLFSPVQMPVRGMFSALAPSALSNGQFALLHDLRFDDGSLMARLPTTNRSATALPGLSNSCRGLWSGKLNGTTYVVGGWYDGSKVGIYFSTNGTSFTAATQSSGAAYWGSTTEAGYASGDNRFHDYGVPLAFAVLTNPFDSLDYLVIQDGTSAPRVFSPSALNGSYVRTIKQYASPSWASSTQVTGLWKLGNLVVGCSASAIGSHTSVTVASSGFIETTFASGSTAGEGVLITLASAQNFSSGQQIVLSSDQANNFPWDQMKVEVSPDNVNWYTLSDPTASPWYSPVLVTWSSPVMDNATPVGGGLNGETLVGYSISQMPASQTNAIKYIKLLWEGATFGASTWGSGSYANILTVHLITGGGPMLAFNTSFAVTSSGAGGVSESAGVVLSGVSANSEMRIGFAGGNAIAPYAAGFYYDHRVTTQVPSLADLQSGCDTVNVYAASFEGSGTFGDYFYLFSDQASIGEFLGGNWVYATTGTTTPPASAPSFATLAGTSVQNIQRYMPDAYALAMPSGAAMAAADGRAFVGCQGSYWISEYQQAFRFRQNLLFENGSPVARSGSQIMMPSQTVRAFATPSGAALASSTVYMFTETKTYAVGGFDGFSLSRPNCVGEVGCSAPGSVTQYKDAIFFLDDNLEQRRFGYGRAFLYGFAGANAYDLMPAISRRVVDDRTKAIPTARLPFVKSCASYDHVYLAYTPSGGSANTRILVFDELVGGYVEDTLPVGADGLVYADLSGGRTLLIAGADGNLYTHEDAGSNAAHTVEITSGETHEHMWTPRFYGRVGMVADVQAGQSASVTKTIKPGLSDASTIDLATDATDQVWRWDTRSGDTQPGLSGASCQVDIQMTMTPGTRVYSIVMEVGTAVAGADQL